MIWIDDNNLIYLGGSYRNPSFCCWHPPLCYRNILLLKRVSRQQSFIFFWLSDRKGYMLLLLSEKRVRSSYLTTVCTVELHQRRHLRKPILNISCFFIDRLFSFLFPFFVLVRPRPRPRLRPRLRSRSGLRSTSSRFRPRSRSDLRSSSRPRSKSSRSRSRWFLRLVEVSWFSFPTSWVSCDQNLAAAIMC